MLQLAVALSTGFSTVPRGQTQYSSHRYGSGNFPVSSWVLRPKWKPLYATTALAKPVILRHEGVDQPNILDNSTQPIIG
jgi:hypothetical protein